MLAHRSLGCVAILCLSISVGARAADHPLRSVNAGINSVSQDLSFGARGADVQQVYQYLRQFGYFPNDDLARRYPGWHAVVAHTPDDSTFFDNSMEDAVRLYQAAHGLMADGRLNAETRALMRRPRCGFPDYYGFTYKPPRVPGIMIEKYELKSPWRHTNLTYGILGLTNDLSESSITTVLSNAMNRWAGAAPLTFTNALYAQDIQFSWAVGDHGDGYPFSSGILGHGFYPVCSKTFTCTGWGGVIHFNNYYSWTTNGDVFGFTANLSSVALHEVGHTLGLGHSADPNAVMYPTDHGQTELQPDDRAGIRALYPVAKDPRTIDAQFYLDANPDLKALFSNNLSMASWNWSIFMRGDGRIAGPAFQVKDYLALQPDLAGYQVIAELFSYQPAIDHWIAFGIREGRQGSLAFDARYYISHYPELNLGATDYLGAIDDWVNRGLSQGLRGSAQFDPKYYLQANPDVAAAYGATNYRGGLLHWLIFGRNENRKVVPPPPGL